MTKPDLLARVRKAHAITAKLALTDDRYWPLFDSLAADLERLEGKDDRAARARAAVQRANEERVS